MMKKNTKLTPDEMIKKHLSKENKINPTTDLLQLALISIGITILATFFSGVAILIIWNFLIVPIFGYFGIFILLINIWISIGIALLLNIIRSIFVK